MDKKLRATTFKLLDMLNKEFIIGRHKERGGYPLLYITIGKDDDRVAITYYDRNKTLNVYRIFLDKIISYCPLQRNTLERLILLWFKDRYGYDPEKTIFYWRRF